MSRKAWNGFAAVLDGLTDASQDYVKLVGDIEVQKSSFSVDVAFLYMVDSPIPQRRASVIFVTP